MISIWVIINPISGGKNKSAIVDKIKESLPKNKFQCSFYFTEYKGHGEQIAKEAASMNIEIVAVVGGDGSVHEVGRSLIHTNTALAIIPSGSGNGFANHFNIPKKLNAAIAKIEQNKCITIDTGLVNNKAFLATMGFGFDAQVAQKFTLSKKRGLLNYIKIVISEIKSFQSIDATILYNNKKKAYKNLFLLNITNTSEFGNGFHIASMANAQDERLDVIIIKKLNLLKTVFLVCRSIRKKVYPSSSIKSFNFSSISIEANVSGFQLDGEYYPTQDKEFKIEVVPKSLKLIC